jgi:hypothetical protein
MKNLKSYQDDSFEFHKEVLNSKYITKRDPKYKERIAAIDNDIKKQFDQYNQHFNSNSLELLNNYGYDTTSKDDLIALYSYSSKNMQALKIKLTTDESNRVINTCQNCTIGEISSFDHILPKEEFAEFSVNPKNLFPSCFICNGHKSVVWRKDGKCVFLNLYLDQLPPIQYLFVKVKLEANNIRTKFYIENRNRIDTDLYEKIFNHYNKLNLCQRYDENIDNVITPLISSINASKTILSVDEIIKLAVETSTRNKVAYGFNYWKSILEIELVNNEYFINQYIK